MMDEKSQKNASADAIWRVYVLISCVFSFVYGIYISYSSLYLSSLIGDSNPLGSVLIVLTCSMFFEFVSEPITGDFADYRGRRLSVVFTLIGLSFCFIIYWFLSFVSFKFSDPGWRQLVIVIVAIFAEFIAAIALSFYTGSLDAWFVDEYALCKKEKTDHRNHFTKQAQYSGVCLILGGVIALLISKGSLVNSRENTVLEVMLSLKVFPWLIASVLALMTSLFAIAAMVENRVVKTDKDQKDNTEENREIQSESFKKRILSRIFSINRNVFIVLVVNSVLYVCWVSYMYLMPLLVTNHDFSYGFDGNLSGDRYWIFYAILGTSRVVGPFITKVTFKENIKHSFYFLGVLNGLFLIISGILSLVLTGEYRYWIVILFLYITKVIEEAFKPSSNTYLHSIIENSKDRAFIVSMGTAFGAVIVSLLTTGLFMLKSLFPVSSVVGQLIYGISIVFITFGFFSVLSIIFLYNISKNKV